MNALSAAAIAVAIEGSGLVLPEPAPSLLPMPPNMGASEHPVYQHRQRRELEQGLPSTARRLGRLQLLMLAAANLAVKDAGIQTAAPSVGVFVGTALGSIGATVEFAQNMILLDEKEPKPTMFINSIHNAAASAVAIHLGCKGENHTFTHDGASFELALLRAAAALRTGRIDHAIVVGGDELSGLIVGAMAQLGWWRTACETLDPLAGSGLPGTLPGEGAAALVLGRADAGNVNRAPVARSVVVEPLAATGAGDLDARQELQFLVRAISRAGGAPEEVDALILGANGDATLDACYKSVAEAFVAAAGKRPAVFCFKQACGEFYTASAIGVALAATTASTGKPAQGLCQVGAMSVQKSISNVLVYNVVPGACHSVFLVSK